MNTEWEAKSTELEAGWDLSSKTGPGDNERAVPCPTGYSPSLRCWAADPVKTDLPCSTGYWKDLDGTCQKQAPWETAGFMEKDWMSLPLSEEVGLLKDLPSAPRSAPLDAEAITEIDLGTLLEVYWVDAESDHGWMTLDEINTEPVPVISVGWMVSRNEKGIVLASTSGADLDHLEDLNGTIVLPIGTLTGFRILD